MTAQPAPNPPGAAATPRPWVHDPADLYTVWTSKAPGHGAVASTNPNHMAYDLDKRQADAVLICRAVNSFAPLVEALTTLMEGMDNLAEFVLSDQSYRSECRRLAALAHGAILLAKGGNHDRS